MIGKALLQILIAIDQLINALLGGWADETLSSRAYRLWQSGLPLGVMKYIIDGLFFWQKDHCKAAYESEQKRTHQPPELRT